MKLCYERFEKYLETHDFDELIYRLILEHNDDYREKCYHNGYEPYPNNKLSFIIEYIKNNTKPIEIKGIKCEFPNTIWEFKGYYFQLIYGQGVITNIYNKDDNRLILQI